MARLRDKMLESLGYYPVVRTNATEAWQAFKMAPQRFDLLITDQAMPELTGGQPALECRRLRTDLPVLLCTSSEQVPSEEETRSQGIAAFILKPFMLQDLAHSIRRVLDRPSQPLPMPSAEPSSRYESPAPLMEEPDAVGPRH